MEFAPEMTSEIQVEGTNYHFGEHPAMPKAPYCQEGRASMVYQIVSDQEKRALKVFKLQHRRPSLVSLSEKLAEFSAIPGLTVCRRTVLVPAKHADLLRQHKDLVYSVMMPWIEGLTWFDILVDRRPLTKGQCLTMARGLCQTLMAMEQKGIAHCDLSGPNMIFPCLLDGAKPSGAQPVELVDVEGLFSIHLPRPEILVSGTYPHNQNKEPRTGEWSDQADRFAGSVLLAEILGWCDARTREYIDRLDKDTFFSETELQTQNEGYQVLRTAVRDNWGSDVADLLERAWNSQTLAQCPTFGEWSLVLPADAAAIVGTNGNSSSRQPDPGNANPEQTVQILLDLAQRLKDQGNAVGALAAYKQALALTLPGSSLHSAVEMLIQTLENGSSRGMEPEPETLIPVKSGALETLKPLDLTDLPEGEWHPAIPEHSSRTRELILIAGAFVIAALLLAIGVLLFSQSTASNLMGQAISGTGFAFSIGLIQAWLFRKRLRKSSRPLFILPALIAGLVAGISGGLLLENRIITTAMIGGLMGAVAGGITAAGQNFLMRSHSTTKIWLLWNIISWGVIWTITWYTSWTLAKTMDIKAANAIATVVIMALTGISLSVFLHYSPEIEF